MDKWIKIPLVIMLVCVTILVIAGTMAFLWGIKLGVDSYSDAPYKNETIYAAHDAFCQGTCASFEADAYEYDGFEDYCACYNKSEDEIPILEYTVSEYYPQYTVGIS